MHLVSTGGNAELQFKALKGVPVKCPTTEASGQLPFGAYQKALPCSLLSLEAVVRKSGRP